MIERNLKYGLDYNAIANCKRKNDDVVNAAKRGILNPEGYVTKQSNGTCNYYYYAKDHLGNNRAVVGTATPTTFGGPQQEINYYPFGMPFYAMGILGGFSTGTQPYKFGDKEYDEMHGLNWYDFGARYYSGIILVFMTMDPLCKKYYSVSPYAYCLNNPVRFVDPDGRDAMLAGSGTREDPYVITARYYYQNGSLDEAQVNGLNSALSAYNNSGRNGVTEIRNDDGSKSYVRYDLSAQGVDNVSEAISATAFETISGETQYYGNIVGTRPNTGNEFGSANNIRVDLNVDNINAGIANGMNSNLLNKGVAIHEVGHNLGGEHSDGTSVMNIVTTTETHNQIGGTTTISHSYPSMSTRFTKIILDRRDTPRANDSGDGRIWTKKP